MQSCKIVPYALHNENYENYKSYATNNGKINSVKYGVESVMLSAYLTVTISILTLMILLFMFASNE